MHTIHVSVPGPFPPPPPFYIAPPRLSSWNNSSFFMENFFSRNCMYHPEQIQHTYRLYMFFSFRTLLYKSSAIMFEYQWPVPMPSPSWICRPVIQRRAPQRRRSTDRMMANCVLTQTHDIIVEKGFSHFEASRHARRFWYAVYSRCRAASVEQTNGWMILSAPQ